tara:strand:+ start:175 stop:354 length:180 start_codon:yes stop_codon:yes gene_type:complete
LYAAGTGYYESNVAETKSAVTVLLAMLTVPIGLFLHRAAHNGFRDAFRKFAESGWQQQG